MNFFLFWFCSMYLKQLLPSQWAPFFIRVFLDKFVSKLLLRHAQREKVKGSSLKYNKEKINVGTQVTRNSSSHYYSLNKIVLSALQLVMFFKMILREDYSSDFMIRSEQGLLYDARCEQGLQMATSSDNYWTLSFNAFNAFVKQNHKNECGVIFNKS